MIDNIKYNVLGVMSGTSLDGIDFALCTFSKNKYWQISIKKTRTIKYTKYWKRKLGELHKKDKNEISRTDVEYGKLIANEINKFIINEKIEIIACHGHTIFHQPENKYTLQIGDGKTITRKTGITTVNNFRNLDVELNGQGAPLVPIGDLYLFTDYKYCINLGGFANISIKNNRIQAYDICPANIVLNKICKSIDTEYDDNGNNARKGKIIPILLEELNKLEFYKSSKPKSLSREWVLEHIQPLITNDKPQDLLHTFCEHIAIQISRNLKDGSALLSGGGAFNSFLVERIKHHSTSKIIIPNNTIINFKEAVIFGLLGVLKVRNEVNCLRSVTGADKDNCGGIIHEP